jgi:hypothetical protein
MQMNGPPLRTPETTMRALLLNLALTLPLLASLACNSGKGSTDEDTGAGGADGASDGGDGTDGTDGTDGGADPDKPVLTNVDAWCYEHTTGESAFFWSVVANYSDPQGDTTVESLTADGITVLAGDTTLATYALVCRDGACLGSWNQADDGVACANAESYTIRLSVADEDGNRSDPVDVVGRVGTDASGR